MIEHPPKAAHLHKKRIDMENPDEVAFWTERFDTTKVRLKAAINAVGNLVKDVETYLKKK